MTEFNTAVSRKSSIVLFKRRPLGGPALPSRTDEEKGKPHDLQPNIVDNAEVTEVRKSDFHSTDVFSWHHLSYVIPVSHNGQRRLLDDISGYVAPGKLTALMGETGSGKVINVEYDSTPLSPLTGKPSRRRFSMRSPNGQTSGSSPVTGLSTAKPFREISVHRRMS